MKVSWKEANYPCRNCGREFPATELDRRMWCTDCRGEVIRRARLFSRVAAVTFSLGLGIYVFSLVGSSPRFMMAYVIMILAAYYFVYKLTQRVAFEIIRDRGVPPPIPRNDG